MPATYAPVNLHPGRYSQVKRLAATLETTIATAIEDLIVRAIGDGLISDVFDGFSAERRDEFVILTINGHELAPLNILDARCLASRLGGFAARTIEGSATTHDLSDGTEITIRRAGRGFSIASGVARIVITEPMVGDVIRQVRRAAA